MKDHLKFKFNNGWGAVLCSNCSKIMLQGSQIPQNIWDAVRPQWFDELEPGRLSLKDIPPMFCCEECEKEYNEKKNREEND